ncbi:MAG: hypothetical protein QXM92_01530 [Candidatus Anstonellales archaeon]
MLNNHNIYSGTFDPILQEHERLRKDIRENSGFLLIKIRGGILYFKIPVVVNGEKNWKQFPTGEELSLQGLAIAWMKAQKVAEFLKGNPTVTQLQDSFDNVVNKEDFNVVDDGITVQEAIKVVYQDFFNRRDRRKLTRRKSSKSDNKCWYRMYGFYYSKLNPKAKVTFSLLKETLDIYGIDDDTGQTNLYLRRYQEMLYAFIKLCKLNKLKGIAGQLEDLKVTKDQWKVQKRPRQKAMTAKEFYYLRKRVLEEATLRNRETREFWMWVFSVQFLYGLRISEILHIKNWTEEYCPAKDPKENNPLKTVFPPLIDTEKNPEHIIYVGNYRDSPSSDNRKKNAKTGWRYVHPISDPEYPNMFEDFGIISGINKHLPRLEKYNRDTFVYKANVNLARWSKKYLGKEVRGTHTFRRASAEIKYLTTENDITYENEMGHRVQIAKSNYIRKDPEVTKRMERKKRLVKLRSNEITNNIDIAKQVLSEVYKNVSPESQKEIFRVITPVFQSLFGHSIKPEELG